MSLHSEEIGLPNFTQINVPLKALLESKGYLADKKISKIKTEMPVNDANQPKQTEQLVQFASRDSLTAFPAQSNKITFADANPEDKVFADSERYLPLHQKQVRAFGEAQKIVYHHDDLSNRSQDSHKKAYEHQYVTFQKPKPIQKQSSIKSQNSKNAGPVIITHNTVVKGMASPKRRASPNLLQQTEGNATRHVAKPNNPNAKTEFTITGRIPDSKEKMNEMINERFPVIEMRYRPLRRCLSLPRFSSPLIDKNPSFYLEKVKKLEEPLQTGPFAPKSQRQKAKGSNWPQTDKRQPRFANPFKDD